MKIKTIYKKEGNFWVVNLATFYTIAAICTPNGENTFGAGISGIAFSYGIIGLFILIKQKVLKEFIEDNAA